MIYTITYNPAVDLVMEVTDFQEGELNRSTKEHYVAGGKGINMSVILKRLGYNSQVLGFIGGFSGRYIQEALEQEGVQHHFVQVAGATRINVKLKSNLETELNAAGPQITQEAFQTFFTYLAEVLTDDDVVFLAGNAAPGLDESAYTKVASLCHEKGAKLVLDTNKQLLKACLVHQPFIIKPNHHELGELFQTDIQTEADILHYVKKLQAFGARHVLVSRGGAGALLVSEYGEVYRSNIPNGKVINSVGAGDSMLAGFMAEYLHSGNLAKSLQQGAATGSATAYSVGIAEKDFIDQLLPQIQVEKL